MQVSPLSCQGLIHTARWALRALADFKVWLNRRLKPPAEALIDVHVHSGGPPHLTSPPKTGERDKSRRCGRTT